MKFNLVESFVIDESDRASLIQGLKDLGYNYKFDKYTDQQLYNIYNERRKAYYKDIEDTVDRYEKSKEKVNNFDFYSEYKGYDILKSSENEFKLDGLDKIFNSEQDIIDYIDSKE